MWVGRPVGRRVYCEAAHTAVHTYTYAHSTVRTHLGSIHGVEHVAKHRDSLVFLHELGAEPLAQDVDHFSAHVEHHHGENEHRAARHNKPNGHTRSKLENKPSYSCS